MAGHENYLRHFLFTPEQVCYRMVECGVGYYHLLLRVCQCLHLVLHRGCDKVNSELLCIENVISGKDYVV